MQHGFENYNNRLRFNQKRWFNDCYHYGVFFCSQAMYQLGGDYWQQFFPKTCKVLIDHQLGDGSWPRCKSEGGQFGHCYSASMCLLALSAPNQPLPVFHR